MTETTETTIDQAEAARRAVEIIKVATGHRPIQTKTDIATAMAALNSAVAGLVSFHAPNDEAGLKMLDLTHEDVVALYRGNRLKHSSGSTVGSEH